MTQTIAKHNGKCALVSTINRQSSALMSCGGTYAETLVWEYDENTKARGRLIGQGEASTDSLFTHQRLVKLFEDTGSCEENDD